MQTVNVSAFGIVLAILGAGLLASPPCSLTRLTDTKFVKSCLQTVICDTETLTCTPMK